MSVTVIIVNWNSGDMLKACLHALSLQTVTPARILVVDNASSDGSANDAEKIKNVTLLHMAENRGFADANNCAFAECDTEFVALLNPDAFPDTNWLERLLAAAKSQPDVAAFGSRQLCQGSAEILDGIGDSYHMSGLAWRERHGLRQRARDLVPVEKFSACAAAALYRRQVLVNVGAFDDDYFCYMEDVDLGFRLRLARHKAMYVPDAVVHHIGSATTGGRHSDFSIYHGHRNLVWTYVKNMPGWLFWACLPLHLMMNLVIVLAFVWRGKGKVILSAKRDALLGLPKMWRKRREIQSRRVVSVAEIWRVLDKRVIPSRDIR